MKSEFGAPEQASRALGASVDALGAVVVRRFRYVSLVAAFLYLSLKVLWVARRLGQRDFLRQVLLQVYFTAVQAVGPVVLLALAVGVVAIAEGIAGIGALSGAENLGRMVTVVVLREIAPLLTGVVVIVRSVTAVAAEIGSMRVQREIEALEVMGIPPLRHLVAPRLFAGMISLFGLNVLFAACALVFGFVISQLLVSLPARLFFGAVLSATEPFDLLALSFKTFVGGMGVFLSACFHGMNVEQSPTEVPVAVSRAALNALVFLVCLHGAVAFASLLHSEDGRITGALL